MRWLEIVFLQHSGLQCFTDCFLACRKNCKLYAWCMDRPCECIKWWLIWFFGTWCFRNAFLKCICSRDAGAAHFFICKITFLYLEDNILLYDSFYSLCTNLNMHKLVLTYISINCRKWHLNWKQKVGEGDKKDLWEAILSTYDEQKSSSFLRYELLNE